MDAKSIDPRDVRWSHEPSGYRVYFWRPLGDLAPRELGVGVPYASGSYELTGASSVEEALGWARANAADRTFTVYAVVDHRAEIHLVHLFGINPTERHVSSDQVKQVRALFAAHGYDREPLMHPVVAVDERVFVVAPEDLEKIRSIDDLVTSLEHLLKAPVRLEALTE